jgi:type I restriction enzyme S subunit
MNPVQQLLTENIGLWTGGDTAKKTGRGRASGSAGTVYGIKKLRELILELAVRGKLVPQDANDESAGALLERIREEKARLVLDGKIKKSNSIAEIASDEKPFSLPQQWEWVRFGAIYSLEYGDNLPAGKRSNSGEYPVYGSNGIVGSHNISFVKSPCIVVGRKGSAGALNLSLCAGCCVTDVAYYCIPPKCLDLIFSFKLFHSLGLDHLGKGIKPGLNRNDAYELLIAIPPIAEQHRIVAKIDELMALCDQLEAGHVDAADAHGKLVSHLLTTLTASQDSTDFSASWQRIAAHFDMLFTTEASIDALTQTLLQLAVMGKLVQQDPNDEPASVLLKRIQAEKSRLALDGKIKKNKPMAAIADDEKPFELSQGWEWARFGEISTIRGELVRPEDFQDCRQIAPDCIEKGTGRLTEIRTVKESGVKGPNSRFFKGQIVYSKIRPSLSKAVLVDFDGLCSADMYPIDAYIDSEFMLKQILSECFLKQVRIAENRIKMPKLNQESLVTFVLPLPPLLEQRRIVAKVDELMALCDQMKARIADAGALQRKLADVIVAQAVA